MVSLLPANVSTILEPTPGKGNLVRALADYQVTAPANFWMVSGRFDAVVMNPPFTPIEQGYRILYAVMEMSNVVIALMPWLTIINSKKRTSDIRIFGLKEVIHLPRDVFPGLRVQTCILNMRKDYAGKTSLRFAGRTGLIKRLMPSLTP